MRLHRTLALGAALLALIVSACAPGEGSSPTAGDVTDPAATDGGMDMETAITIGSANFYEAAVVAEIYAQALENAGYTVERQLELGARDVLYAALESGDINLTPEYIGGALAQQYSGTPTADTQETYEALQTELEADGLVAFEPSPGTDADGFVVRQETADEFGLTTMSDVAEVADQLVWGLAPECGENPNCGPGLNEVYGIDISQVEVESLAPCSSAMAEALNASAIDVAQVCTTQPDIERFNFVLLDDDGQLQPAQNMVPIATQELADEAGDALAGTLNAVSELLTTEELTSLGVQVAVDQESLEDAARQWLEDNGLL
ncbi:MAG: glycine betaine ABC transporter substrate-binding protein [Candidatus Limnocylindria bacterium]